MESGSFWDYWTEFKASPGAWIGQFGRNYGDAVTQGAATAADTLGNAATGAAAGGLGPYIPGYAGGVEFLRDPVTNFDLFWQNYKQEATETYSPIVNAAKETGGKVFRFAGLAVTSAVLTQLILIGLTVYVVLRFKLWKVVFGG